MTQRKPQIGDVYDLIGTYRVYRGGQNRHDLRSSLKVVMNSHIFITDGEYKGTVAPRYKRIFGIYFVRDNDGNT